MDCIIGVMSKNILSNSMSQIFPVNFLLEVLNSQLYFIMCSFFLNIAWGSFFFSIYISNCPIRAVEKPIEFSIDRTYMTLFLDSIQFLNLLIYHYAISHCLHYYKYIRFGVKNKSFNYFPFQSYFDYSRYLALISTLI